MLALVVFRGRPPPGQSYPTKARDTFVLASSHILHNMPKIHMIDV